MERQTQNIFLGLAALVVVVLLGYLAWKERGTSTSSTTGTSTATTIASSTASTSTNPGYIITPVPISKSNLPKSPNYAAPLVFSSPTSADEQASMQTQFAQVQAILKTTPLDFNAWIELGTLRKEAGDYTGAAADWQYVSQVYPSNVVSFANLADLYTNFLLDYPKAAAAYKQEIKNNPRQVYIYEDLFQLYTNQYPQPASVVEAMLKEGVAANPGSTELQTTLIQYEKQIGK